MPEFKFQQFSICDDGAAMKVGTDGILLGGWTECSNVQSVLDIGTGCGLIALMIAQRTCSKCSIRDFETNIVAVEIEPSAARQAENNFRKSPWSDRIKVIQKPVQDLVASNKQTFDLIVCNPPFFDANQSTDSATSHRASHPRHIARADSNLSKDKLFETVSQLLIDGGRFNIIYPYGQSTQMIKTATQTGLMLVRHTNVRPLPDARFKRVLLEFAKPIRDQQKDAPIVTPSELTIESRHHNYTPEFESLTSEFYLRFAK